MFDSETLGYTHYARDYIHVNVLSIMIYTLFMHTVFQGRSHVLFQKSHVYKKIN